MNKSGIPYARRSGYVEELSEPEQKAIDALRVWQRAQTDPEFSAHLDAWELLEIVTNCILEGDSEGVLYFAGDDAPLIATAHNVAAFVTRDAKERLQRAEEWRKQGKTGGRYYPLGTEGAAPDAI